MIFYHLSKTGKIIQCEKDLKECPYTIFDHFPNHHSAEKEKIYRENNDYKVLSITKNDYQINKAKKLINNHLIQEYNTENIIQNGKILNKIIQYRIPYDINRNIINYKEQSRIASEINNVFQELIFINNNTPIEVKPIIKGNKAKIGKNIINNLFPTKIINSLTNEIIFTTPKSKEARKLKLNNIPKIMNNNGSFVNLQNIIYFINDSPPKTIKAVEVTREISRKIKIDKNYQIYQLTNNTHKDYIDVRSATTPQRIMSELLKLYRKKSVGINEKLNDFLDGNKTLEKFSFTHKKPVFDGFPDDVRAFSNDDYIFEDSIAMLYLPNRDSDSIYSSVTDFDLDYRDWVIGFWYYLSL